MGSAVDAANCSTVSRYSMAGSTPMTVQNNTPTRLANTTACSNKRPLANSIANPAQKVSPPAVVSTDKYVFGLIRRSPNQGKVILCLVNVSGKQLDIEIDRAMEGIQHDGSSHDLIGGGVYQPDEGILKLSVESYRAMWLACP